MADGIVAAHVPAGGIWRVGRNPEPLSVVAPKARDLRAKRAGNRFDIPGVPVLYFASKLEGSFAEVLARFRPKPALAKMVVDEWNAASHLKPGAIPAGWRHRRSAVRVNIDRAYEFLDVDQLGTHQALSAELALGLSVLGCKELDVGAVRGSDRRVTRLLAHWAYEQQTDDGYGRFAGIRYASRLSTEWTCWAVFPGVELDPRQALPIEREMQPLINIADRFGLRIF